MRDFVLAAVVFAAMALSGAMAHAQEECAEGQTANGDCGGAVIDTPVENVSPAPGSPSRFRICADPGRWGTSAQYLQRTARCVYEGSPREQDALRVALIEDIYIKSWSYAALNKGFFWLSMVLAALILSWPALGAILRPADPPEGEEAPPPTRLQRAVIAPSVQTSVTALAAFSFAFYAHYKEKQAVSETLMRSVLYAQTIDQPLIDGVVAQMTEMDKGFGFSTSAQPPVVPGGS